MTVYLLVRRKRTNVFLDASESVEIVTIKRMLSGILGRSPDEQELYYLKESASSEDMVTGDNDMIVESAILLQNDKRLIDYFISTNHAKPQSPALIGLSLKSDDGTFEPLDITPYSTPPPLPDIMNPTGKSGPNDSNHVGDGIKKD